MGYDGMTYAGRLAAIEYKLPSAQRKRLNALKKAERKAWGAMMEVHMPTSELSSAWQSAADAERNYREEIGAFIQD